MKTQGWRWRDMRTETHLYGDPNPPTATAARDDHDARHKRYRDYLRSPEWRQKRQAAIAAAGGRCQYCNTTTNLEVHHRTYARIFHEELSDLTVMCDPCHAVLSLAPRQSSKMSRKAWKSKRRKERQARRLAKQRRAAA